MFLANKQRKKGFLHKIITCDEKWVYFENPTHKKSIVLKEEPPLLAPKAPFHGKKCLLRIWWDIHGIIYYEILNEGETITAERYSQMLKRMNDALKQRRPWKGQGTRPVYLLHDNAKPHTAKLTQETINGLSWNVLPHAAYSPDMAPSDYYLFRSLEHFLREKSYKNRGEVENALVTFFNSKTEKWYRDGIHELPERWARCIASEGDYFHND